MGITNLWMDEIRFIFNPPKGEGDLHLYVLWRTDDHIACPHVCLGWKYRNMGKVTIHQALEQLKTTSDTEFYTWENKTPPENQYGIEITKALEQSRTLINQFKTGL